MRGRSTAAELIRQRPTGLLDPTAGANLGFSEFEVQPIFPVLYKYYDTVPIGSVVVSNNGEMTLDEVEVRLNMTTYIDNPKLSERITSLAPGESVTVPIFALFNEQVREITEGEKVAAIVSADFRVEEIEASDQETFTVEFYDRNAVRWDDDRKVAAFVTTRDAELQPFARQLAALARQNRRPGVSANLQSAMFMYAGMVEQGLAYVIDPSSAYEELSQNPFAVDFVQFPRQTLAYKAGDCDDLSVCFSALMESVGVETAFITTPGHIFVAFRADLRESDLQRIYTRPQDFIVREDGSVWVPIEITVLDRGFNQAWEIGARQWREASAAGAARFYPTNEAWSVYQPVAYTGNEELSSLDGEAIASGVAQSLELFVQREVAPRELDLLSRLDQRPGDPRLLNRLGALYARYGLIDKAEQAFIDATEQRNYTPSLVNLGNIAMLQERLLDAQRYYERALDADPGNVYALLGVARASHGLENYGTSSRYYEQLAEIDPQLAEQFSYLELRGEEAARASDAVQLRERMLWDEEVAE